MFEESTQLILCCSTSECIESAVLFSKNNYDENEKLKFEISSLFEKSKLWTFDCRVEAERGLFTSLFIIGFTMRGKKIPSAFLCSVVVASLVATVP